MKVRPWRDPITDIAGMLGMQHELSLGKRLVSDH